MHLAHKAPILLVLALFIAWPSKGHAQTVQMPVTAFIDAQPSNVLGGWTDPATFRVLYIDMFGKRAAFFGLDFGITFDGSVKMSELGDGRSRVTVLLHTRNAICWGVQLGPEWAGPPQPAFGYSALNVSQGLGGASFGDATSRIVFTMPSGAPLPNVNELWSSTDYLLEFYMTSVNCQGELRTGSGYPDGTPGAARTTQTVLLSTGVPAGCPPERDANCAPAEKVEFWPTGRF